MVTTQTPPANPATRLIPFASIALGDVVTLPDGRSYTVRARASLPQPVATMSGFVILGELELLVSTPSSLTAPMNVYVPIDALPEYAKGNRARTCYQGAMRYWAPHLPAVGGAMGELLFRVLEVRAQLDPIVLVYRGTELVVFVKAQVVWPQDLAVEHMDRGVRNEASVQRFAGVVIPSDRRIPTPAEVPSHPRHYQRHTVLGR